MKITKSRLKEIIRETIEEEMNVPIWEQYLDENWFSDMKAKAQQAYIKANPTSKYAKGVKSGEKEAPETRKQKSVRKDKEEKDKKERKKEKEKEREKDRTQNLWAARDHLSPKNKKLLDSSGKGWKDVEEKVMKKTGVDLYPARIIQSIENGRLGGDGPDQIKKLDSFLTNPNSKTLKAFTSTLPNGIDGGLLGTTPEGRREKEKINKQKSKSYGDSGDSKRRDTATDLGKAMTTGTF